MMSISITEYCQTLYDTYSFKKSEKKLEVEMSLLNPDVIPQWERKFKGIFCRSTEKYPFLPGNFNPSGFPVL